jgi:hypothetical protein
MVVSMKNAVFWVVTPCGSCKNRLSEERIASIISMIILVVQGTTSAVTSSNKLRRDARRNIPVDGILHINRRENLKSYITLTGCAL